MSQAKQSARKPSRQSVLSALEIYRSVDPAFMEWVCPELYSYQELHEAVHSTKLDLGVDCDGEPWEHSDEDRDYLEMAVEAGEYIIQARKWYRFTEAELDHLTR